MAEANKEAALQWAQKGIAALDAGDAPNALRLLSKALRLYPDLGPRVAAARDRAAAAVEGHAAPSSEGGSDVAPSPSPARPSEASAGPRRRAAPAPAPAAREEPPARPYTPEQAEAAKRVMSAKDLYSVLGVEKGASEDDIKRAYKKVAVKVHPDKNAAPQAVEAFKRLAKAYSMLSDADKRAHYDRFGEQEEGAAAGGGGRGGMPPFARAGPMGGMGGGDISPDELFNMLFGMGLGGMAGRRGFQQGVYVRRQGGARRAHPAHDDDEEEGPSRGWAQLVQLLPFLLFVVFSLLNFGAFGGDDRAFSLQPAGAYDVRRVTRERGVPFWVKRDFDAAVRRDHFAQARVEQQVEAETRATLQSSCERELIRRGINPRRVDLRNLNADRENLPACASFQQYFGGPAGTGTAPKAAAGSAKPGEYGWG